MAITIFQRTIEPISAGGNQLLVNGGHPLAGCLQAAFSGSAANGNNVNTFIFNQRELTQGRNVLASWNAAVSIGTSPGIGRGVYGGLYSGSGVSVTTNLKPSFPVSIVWFGSLIGDQTSNYCRFAGVSYGSGGDPYDAYAIGRLNNQTDMYWGTNQGGAGTGISCTATGVLSSSNYKAKPMVFGGTFCTTGIYGYKNGVLVASNVTSLSNLSYGATPTLVTELDPNNAFSGRANATTSLVLVFSRALTASEHMQLAQNPYAVFTAGPLRGRFLGRGVLDAPFNALLIAP